MGDMTNACKILVAKPEEKRPLRRPGRRWENNIRMHLRGTVCEGVDWLHLVQGRVQWWDLLNVVLQKVGTFLTSSVTISFSRRTLLHGVTSLVGWSVSLLDLFTEM
jgi:hypothetical protein